MLVLASGSPQRRTILSRLGVAFDVRPADVEELAAGEPHAVARENALLKARTVAAALAPPEADALVLGVDTLVALDGVIYGKPADEEHARATLRALSGATHDVVSGLALVQGDVVEAATAVTRVTFRRLDPATIDWYLALGEWRGRAGGYAIQEAGGALVRSIEGDYQNVVGLPVSLLLDRRPGLLH
ncbi:septum formation protein Maf [Conexibacter sp. W3-3-2]|uniref:Maf family protein n=1 Tax=Conexibacter sp. W3-3-2 TaxID=2675227 RepID=UPI001320D52C|nr:Maf family protein [Conexibacter sp. W3-3-2]MTD42781.1 septum formation protein Maf [Conexibacter sp. W3-3-2]